MPDRHDSAQVPTGGTGGRSDQPWTVSEQREGLVLSVPYQRLVWLGLLAKHGSYSDYSKAIRALMKINAEVCRLLSEVEHLLDVRTVTDVKDSGPGLTRDERFDWLLNAPFDQRLQWLRHAPIEHRVEWIFDRTIDPVGAPIDRAQLTELLQDIEQQAHEAYQASTEHMRTTLSEIWLQLEYLIPLIEADK